MGLTTFGGDSAAAGWNEMGSIKGSKRRLRELRNQGKPIRVFYSFDPRRDAVLLLGGDKTGDERFYERLLPKAEKIWETYLREQRTGKYDDED